MRPKNNPKNRRGLLEYQKRQLELSKRTESEARKRRIESNLEKWVNSLPNELKKSMPNKLPKTLIEKIKGTSLKPPYNKYTIVSAEDISTARFTSYSIIYALIQGGFVTPSEVKITDIMDGYNNINGMFNSRQWKDYFFDDNGEKYTTINGENIKIYSYENSYMTVFSYKGVNFDIETSNVDVNEFRNILELIIK